MKKFFNQSAFNLIEVIIATAILATSIVTLQASWSGSIRAVQKSKSLQVAARLLENKMTEFEVKYRSNMDELPEEDSGNFEAYPDYRWEMRSVDFVAPDFAAILQQSGGQEQMVLDMLRRMTSIFEEHIKEVEITVYVKLAGKEMKFNVTSLFVNYDKPINMMGNL